MIINVHAGHNPDGKIACGAVGYIKESTEARNVKNNLILELRNRGHIVYDCTCDNGISQNDVLKKIVKKTNTVKANIDISIHFNSMANKDPGNGKTTGTEVWIYPGSSLKTQAQNVCNNISALGYKNRGVKYSTSLYYLKNCKNPAMLIEVCFVNDMDDIRIYNSKNIAKAIADALSPDNIINNSKLMYQGIDYSPVFNYIYYSDYNQDVFAAFGKDKNALFKHFCTFGMKEGRKGCSDFDVRVYKNNNPDLVAAFGEQLIEYYRHYCLFGKNENRICK